MLVWRGVSIGVGVVWSFHWCWCGVEIPSVLVWCGVSIGVGVAWRFHWCLCGVEIPLVFVWCGVSIGVSAGVQLVWVWHFYQCGRGACVRIPTRRA